MKKNLDNPIIKRFLIAFDIKKMIDIANLFNTSSQNINGLIDRGTFLNFIESECYKRKVNIDWIKTGEGEMNISSSDPKLSVAQIDDSISHIPDARIYAVSNSTPPPAPVKISDLLQKAAKVLESETPFASALKENIESFHYAVDCVNDLSEARKMIKEHEERLKAIEVKLSPG